MSEQKNEMRMVVKVLVFLLAFGVSGFFGAGVLLFTGSLFLSTAGAGASFLSSGIALSSDVMADINKVIKRATTEAKAKKAEKEREAEAARRKAEEKAKEAESIQEEEKPIENVPETPTKELEREAKKWQESPDYKKSEGKYFSFSLKTDQFGYVSWVATSKIKIGDCPAKSVWSMGYADAERWNKTPSKCISITPSIIKDFQGYPPCDEGSEGEDCG